MVKYIVLFVNKKRKHNLFASNVYELDMSIWITNVLFVSPKFYSLIMFICLLYDVWKVSTTTKLFLFFHFGNIFIWIRRIASTCSFLSVCWSVFFVTNRIKWWYTYTYIIIYSVEQNQFFIAIIYLSSIILKTQLWTLVCNTF